MSFFPLPYRANIQEKIIEKDRSGQERVVGWTTIEVTRCLYLATSGNKKSSQKEDFEATIAFYTKPGSLIDEGHRVTDIVDKNGNIVEAGPFEVRSVKNVPGLSGHIHHISAKIIGVA